MPLLNLVMDGFLLLFLAGTMFFAWHLSKSLNAFRKGRKDLERLVRDLAAHIDRADRAIAGMKNAARDSGGVLEVLIDQSKALSEEMQLMIESGDNLASRLERLADRNRDSAPPVLPRKDPPPRRAREESKQAPAGPSFAIRDHDMDPRRKAGGRGDDSAFSGDDDFVTRAERELLEALGGRAKGGGGS